MHTMQKHIALPSLILKEPYHFEDQRHLIFFFEFMSFIVSRNCINVKS